MKGYEALMGEPAPEPKVFIADRGYDTDAIRQDLSERGATPVIPTKKNRKVQIPIDDYIYALRNRVERCINRLKHFRRFATRYDKLRETFHGFVNIAAIRLWMRDFATL